MNMEKMSDIEKLIVRWLLGLLTAGVLFLAKEHWAINEWRAATSANRYTIKDAHQDWKDYGLEREEMIGRITELEFKVRKLEEQK